LAGRQNTTTGRANTAVETTPRGSGGIGLAAFAAQIP
jgi:hypothetical protein